MDHACQPYLIEMGKGICHLPPSFQGQGENKSVNRGDGLGTLNPLLKCSLPHHHHQLSPRSSLSIQKSRPHRATCTHRPVNFVSLRKSTIRLCHSNRCRMWVLPHYNLTYTGYLPERCADQ